MKTQENVSTFLERFIPVHNIYPVKKTFRSGTIKYYVMLLSRSIENGSLQKIHIEVKDQNHASILAEQLAAAIRTTKDKCVVHQLLAKDDIKPKEKPQKLEAGNYRYRGFEIMDFYDPVQGGSKEGRWYIKEIPEGTEWLDQKEYFGFTDRLFDALIYIDRHLEKQG